MDNHLLTGGCRYVNECENFTNNCKNCLAFKKKFQKISVDNYSYFRNYFDKINPMFMLPSNYSKDFFFKKSKLNYDFIEFDFWPIELKNKNKSIDFEYYISSKDTKIKTIICLIQKFSEPRKGWNFLSIYN